MAKKQKSGAAPIAGSEEITMPGRPADDSQLAVAAAGDATRRERVPAIASRVADAAAAQLLIFDELPEDERPRKDDRVLLLGLVWGGSTLVELEQVARGSDLPVKRLFDLPAVKLPKNFPIVKHVNGGHVFTLPSEIGAEVHSGAEVIPLEHKGRRIDAPFKGNSYSIGDDDRIVAQIGPQLTLIARYVRAARHPDKTLLEQVDIPFASTVLVALLGLALFSLMGSITPRPAERFFGGL